MPREVQVGRRIAIYGPSGSGKTTLGRLLGEKLGLPSIDLDLIYHPGPTWDQDLATPEFRRQVTEMLAKHPNGWVIAGNYSAVRDLILPEAETAIWLRLPFPVVYRRLAWRTISRAVTGEEIFNGLHESMKQTFVTTDSMLWWGIKSWHPHIRSLQESLIDKPPAAKVYVLKTTGQVGYLLQNARSPRPQERGPRG